MKRTLDQFYLLPLNVRLTLEKNGVHNMDSLLDHSAWTHDREKLRKKTGLNDSDLRPWIVAADLCRIKGIAPREIQEIALSGLVSSAKGVANLTDEQLRLWFNQKTGYADDFIAQIRSNAASLPPRVIWDDQDVDNYEEITHGYLQSIKIKQGKAMRYLSLGFALFFVAMVIYLLTLLVNNLREAIERLYLILFVISVGLPGMMLFLSNLIISTFLGLCWALGMMKLGSYFFSKVSLFIKRRIKNKLYRKLDLFTNYDQTPIFRTSNFIFSIMFLVIAIVAVITLSSEQGETAINYTKFAPLFAIILTLAVSLTEYKNVLSKINEQKDKRYRTILPLFFSMRLFFAILIPFYIVFALLILQSIGIAYQTWLSQPVWSAFAQWLDLWDQLSQLLEPASLLQQDVVIFLQNIRSTAQEAASYSILGLLDAEFYGLFLRMTLWATITYAFVSALLPQLVLKERKKSSWFL